MGTQRAVDRAAAVAAIGHDEAASLERVIAATTDDDAVVRAAALGALARRRSLPFSVWRAAISDAEARVRSRAAELAGDVRDVRVDGSTAAGCAHGLVALLDDPELSVVEAAAWSLGELADTSVGPAGLDALVRVATDHADALGREAAVAALGAIGDERALPAILRCCRDKPAVRRRAVLALAPFEGPEVDAALVTAATDRDWQVRQAAEDLRSVGGP